MVPSHFMMLTSFPLSTNGKVDTKALPLPKTPVPSAVVSSLSNQQSKYEELMIKAVQDVLQRGKQKVGVTSNLFELGLNSFHLMSLHSKLQQLFPSIFNTYILSFRIYLSPC